MKGNISIVKKLGNEITLRKDDHNTITKLFKNLILAETVGHLFTSAQATELGVVRAFAPQRYAGNASNQTYKTSGNIKNNFCIYLCNLSQEDLESLSPESKKYPFLNDNYTINNNKLIGYAQLDYKTGNKRGQLGLIDDIHNVNGDEMGLGFTWTAGTLSGTVNAIIVGTSCVEGYPSGISISKGIDVHDYLNHGTYSSHRYLTNNVALPNGTVITGPNEILLGDEDEPTKARRVLNMLTGESEFLQDTDPRYNAYLYDVSHTYIGQGRILKDGWSGSIDTYDLTSPTTTTSQLAPTSNGRGCFVYNNLIYVAYMASNTTYFRVFDMATLNTVKDFSLTATDWASQTFYESGQSGFNATPVHFSNFMDKFLMCNTPDSTSPSIDSRGLVFTDPDDPFGSIVCAYGGERGANLVLLDENENIEDYRYLIYRQVGNAGTLQGDEVWNSLNARNGTTRLGVKFITPDYYGQMLTYSKLSEPITINSDESLHIDYMWSFE